MKKSKKDKIINLILTLTPIAIIIVLWVVSASAIGSEYVLPNLTLTFNALINLLKKGAFYCDVFATLLRSSIAFLISFIIATSLAVLTKKFCRAKYVINPIMSIFRALPTIAIVLLLLVWTSPDVAPVIVTTLVVLPTTYTSVTVALNGVDDKQLEMCRLYKVNPRDVLLKVIIPQIAPDMITVVGAGLTLNLKLMVAAEVIGKTVNSLGYILNTSKINYEYATMFAVVVVTVALGVIIEFVFNLISKKVGKWK